jgi:cell division protein FtsB
MTLRDEIRNRARKAAPQVLAACMVGYFAYHALQGDRGFNAWVQTKQALREARAENEALAAQQAELTHRVEMLRPDHLDPDLLEERARIMLNFGLPGEYVILYPQADKTE